MPISSSAHAIITILEHRADFLEKIQSCTKSCIKDSRDGFRFENHC